MLIVDVNKSVRPNRLHEELAAAGLRVITVRARGETAQVVLEDGEDVSKVSPVVTAHDANADPERTRVTAALAILEDPAKPQAQRLSVACEVLARLLRDRLSQRT